VFRRHADRTDGMDTGECSAIHFSRCFSLVIIEVYGETKAYRKHRDGSGDPRRVRI